MADFCNQCARDNGFPVGDFNYQRKDEEGNPMVLLEGEAWVELCEGCGYCTVNDQGNRFNSLYPDALSKLKG